MVSQQLFDYIKQQLQQGINQDQIKNSLIANGWKEVDINEAFTSMRLSTPSTPPNNVATKQFSTTPQQPTRKINKTLLAVISILGILIIGGGAFGYFYYFIDTPGKVIAKMITNLTEVKTLEYNGEIKAEATTTELLGGANSINFSGKSDIEDLNNPKVLFVFDIKTDALKELIQGELTFGLEVRAINKVVYIKLNNLPNLGFIDLSVLLNQWIKIDREAINKQFESEKSKEQIKDNQNQQKLTPEQIENLKQIVKQTKVFKVTEKLANEKIEGVDTHHYKFLIDKNELKKLIVEINKVVSDKTLTNEEIADIGNELNNKTETLGGEIWIGKKDYLPYKIILTLKIKEIDGSKGVGQLNATLSFKNYNKPVQIDVPSPVKNIEEILSTFFGGFLDGMNLPSI